MTTKTCTDCNERFSLPNFYKGSAKCKPCYKKRVSKNRVEKIDKYREYERQRGMLPHRIAGRKKYSETTAGKAAQARARKKWLSQNSSKRAAHVILGNAVRDGKILKPDACSVCGYLGRIDGHHDDYTKPLDVTWLCRSCHVKHHKELNDA